ncbi:hypothetical protein ACI2US_03010 [Ralstonia nicotianae]|nr:hypothetical protein G7968_07700 [Ralstonia solanacearum]BCL97645.1 hypothetical protein MAFF211491_20970 [Ralstonia solanacearum]BCM13087.1 hypothetical protein MAFF241648_22770 [Ralstonia solanacearum]
MCHTFGYKGHFIHVSSLSGSEVIQAQREHADGGFDVVQCRTVAGAKRLITRWVKGAA